MPVSTASPRENLLNCVFVQVVHKGFFRWWRVFRMLPPMRCALQKEGNGDVPSERRRKEAPSVFCARRDQRRAEW
jgi:hypothetical protein